MKITFLLSALGLLLSLSNCTLPAYVVTSIHYTGAQPGAAPSSPVEVVHDDLRLIYRFWGDKGPLRLEVHNELDTTITLDLRRSSLIINGQSRPYYQTVANTEFVFYGVSVYYGTLHEGTAFTVFDQESLSIPPHAFVTIQKFYMAVPLPPAPLPRVAPHQVKTLTETPYEPLTMRHHLAYTVEGSTPRQGIVEDTFETGNSQLMGIDAFEAYQQQYLDQTPALETYRIQRQAAPVLTLLGTLVTVSVVALLALAANSE